MYIDFSQDFSHPDVQRLLASTPVSGMFYSNIGAHTLPNIPEPLTLSHAILARPSRSKKHPQQLRFDMLGDVIGSGGTANVYAVEKTLFICPETKRLTCNNKYKQRVTKMIRADSKTRMAWAVNEYNISKRVQHLHIKQWVLDRTQQALFITMRCLPGKPLSDYIENNRNMCLETRLILSRVSRHIFLLFSI